MQDKKILLNATFIVIIYAVAITFAACYTQFHAADVDLKTYPVHRQDSVRK